MATPGNTAIHHAWRSTKDELKTLPVGVNDLFNATIVDWGMIMAAGVMITVPTIAFFVAVQRYLIQGWGAGGVKG